jgi:MFS family permease
MARAPPLSHTFWWLWTGVLVAALATFVFPFLALYLSARGLPADRIGLLVSLLGAGAVVAGPLGGSISDRFGRRPAVIGALISSAAAAAYLGVVHRPALIAPGIFVFGVGAMMTYPTVNAMVADLVPASELQRAYSLLAWAQNIGVAISAVVGGVLANKSWILLFWADAATSLLFAVLVYRRVPESRPTANAAPRGWQYLFRDRALLGFVAAQLLFVLMWWQFQFAVPIAMQRQGFGSASFGIVLATNCVYLFCLLPFVATRMSRFDAGRLLAVASLLVGCGYGAYAFCSTLPQYLAATLVWSTGELVGMPAASAVIAELAPEDLRGRYQGAYGFSFSAGMMLTPIAGGLVIARFSPRALWLSCFAVGAATAALHYLLGAARAEAKVRREAAVPAP